MIKQLLVFPKKLKSDKICICTNFMCTLYSIHAGFFYPLFMPNFILFQVFTRDELVSEGGHVEVHIRVNNTQLGLVTYWDLAKFETRLDQMRDIYQATPTPGSASSMDSDSINLSGGEDQGDPFNDPTDNWVKDSAITPLPSPHR